MNDALYIAATGMQAQQTQLEVIANNVANASTPGYKRSSVSFLDLVQRLPDAVDPADARARTANAMPGEALGAGVAVGAVRRQFAAGDLKRTSQPLDLAIQGAGFLEVLLPDGSTAYSRGGTLQVDPDGMLATADGYPLKQRIQLPADVHGFAIAGDGTVAITDGKAAMRTLGRIELATFSNPEGLESVGEGLYRASDISGDALAASPGEAGAGRLVQGSVEQSNVQLVDEMVQLMVAQRAYEMNVKVIQAADELAGLANGLRK